MLKSNMRFTLIVILMIFALSVTGSACSEEPITFGTLEGSVYENEYLGIGCQLDGWHYYDRDELQETNARS